MYRQDSFFDLSAFGQAGLVVISTTLFLLALLLTWKLLTPRGPALRIAGALLLFWVFVWVSPQIYYMYYLTLIPDLPLQWVIWPPAGPDKPFQMLLFQYRQNLSAHFQGFLGWCMLAAPFAQDLWRQLKHRNR